MGTSIVNSPSKFIIPPLKGTNTGTYSFLYTFSNIKQSELSARFLWLIMFYVKFVVNSFAKSTQFRSTFYTISLIIPIRLLIQIQYNFLAKCTVAFNSDGGLKRLKLLCENYQTLTHLEKKSNKKHHRVHITQIAHSFATDS
jgi:hypothetical protein